MKTKAVISILAMLGTTAACASDTQTQGQQLANPAATFCVDSGHKYEIKTAADGSQSGVCILQDGTEVDAWEYFRENAPKDE